MKDELNEALERKLRELLDAGARVVTIASGRATQGIAAILNDMNDMGDPVVIILDKVKRSHV